MKAVRKEQFDASNEKRRVPPDQRIRRNLSGLSAENKEKEHKHTKKCHVVEKKDVRKQRAKKLKENKRVKFFRNRLENRYQKEDTFGLCSSLYISKSEILHQYDEYDAETDKDRLRQLLDDEDEVDFYQQVNEFSQTLDFGGWRTKKDGSPAVQKWHKDMDGDYYICPYCTAYLLPTEVEAATKKLYQYPCCHKGTMRTLIEMEKVRPESKFARYLIFFSSVLDRINLKYICFI